MSRNDVEQTDEDSANKDDLTETRETRRVNRVRDTGTQTITEDSLDKAAR